MPSIAHAVNYTWDASGGDPTEDGSGTWSSSGGTNWFDGTTYGAWGNTTSDIAFFGVGSGAAGTITVSGSVATNGITFNNAGSGNYTLTGGTIGFGGTTPTITVNATGTSSIGSLLSGATLTKSGAGTLALSGSGSTFTGALTQSAGGILNTGSFSTVGINVNGGSFMNANRVTNTSVLTINGSNAVFANAGTYSGGSGAITIRGFGAISNTGTMTGNATNLGASSGSGDQNVNTPVTFTNAAGASATINAGSGYSLNVGREYFAAVTNAGYLRAFGIQIGRGRSQGTSVTLAGTSSVTITSGTIDSSGGGIALRAENSTYSNATAEMNLNGGLWVTDTPAISVSTSGNSGTNHRFFVNFNSGTFRTTNSVGTTIMPATLTAVTLNAGGGTLDIGTLSSGSNTIAATIIGTGGLTKTGVGTLSLTGSNSFSGSTRLVAGSLSIGNADALRNSTLELLNGDTGVVSAIGQNSTLGGLSGSRNLDMLTRTLSIGNNNASTTYSGQLSNGLLTKIGTGTLSVTGSNSFAGTTSINGGVLSLGNAGALGSSGAISFGGGTMQFTAANTTDYSSRFTSGQTFNIDTNGQNVAFASVPFGNGTLRKTGVGDLTLSGSIQVQAANIYNSGPGTLTVSGTIFKNSAAIALQADAGSGGFLVSGGIAGTTNSVNLSGDGTGTISGPITTAYAITKTGTGTWILSGSNSYTVNGNTLLNINAGVLNIRHGSAFGVTGNIPTVTAGAALELQGGISVPNALRLNGLGVSDGGALRNVSGDNTYTGQITLQSDSRVNSDAGTLTLDVASGSGITGAFNLSIGGAGDVVVADPIATGVGQLIKDGAGTLRLTGASTYTGQTAVNAGTLQIGNGSTTGALSSSSAITGSSGAMLVFNRTDSYGGDFSNTIGGDLAVRLSAGTLTLAGNNSYTGGTELTSGRLSLGSANAIGSAGTIAFAGGTMQFTSSNTTDYSSRFSTAGSQAFNIDTNGQSVTLATGLVGTGNTLAKIGTGTLSLTGSNSLTTTAINAGVLSLGNANAIGSAGTISFGGGTMQFTASNTTDYSSRFSTANSQAFNFDTNGQNVTLATAFQGTGSTLRKAGTGLLTLSGSPSTIAGGVTVESGTLLNTGSLSIGGASVSANSTLQNQGSVTLTGDVTAGASGAAIVNSGQFLQSSYRNLTIRSTASVTNSGTMGFGGFFMGNAGVTAEVATFTNNAGGSFSSGDTGIGGANFATFTNAGGTYGINSGLTLGRSNGVMTAGTTALTVTSGTVTAGSGGAIVLSISGTVSNATAEINLNGGLFSAGRGITTSLGTGTNNALLVNFGGGTLRGTGANAILLPSSLTAVNLNAGGGTVEIGSGVTNTIAAGMAGVGGLTKSGSGTLILSSLSNTYAGNSAVTGGTLQIGDGSTLAGSLPGNVVLSNASTLAFNSTVDQSYAGLISGTGSLAKTGAGGVLTLSGVGNVARNGVTINSGALLNTGSLSTGSGANAGNVVLTSGTYTNQGQHRLVGSLSVGTGARFANSGTTTLDAGSFFQVSGTGSGQNAGTMNLDFFRLNGTGASAAPSTFVNDASGSMTIDSFILGDTGVGSFTNDGGRLTIPSTGGQFTIGRSGGTVAGTSSLTVNSGTVTNMNTTTFRLGDYGNGSNTTAAVNINGGLFETVGSLAQVASSGTNNAAFINFNGGTLRGLTNGATLLASNLTGVTFGAGGGTIDLGDGITSTAAAVMSGVGGLTKTGAGVLSLTGANTYAGATTIAAGRLALGAAGSFANSPSIIVGGSDSSGVVLDLTAKTGAFDIGSLQELSGGGTVQLASSGTLNVLGSLSPGNSPGLLTFEAGTTVLAGSTIMEIFGTDRATSPSHGSGFYDAVNVTGGGTLSFGGELVLDFSQEFATNSSFNLFSPLGGSTLTGNFSSVNVTGSFYTGLTWNQTGSGWKSSNTGSGQSLEFSSATGTLVIVPEPGAIALAGLGIALAGWMIRRRSR